MDYKVGTADGQSEGLQVLGVGEPWPIYLEGMEECYILEPLVIGGLSHRVNLGISFLTRNNLKLICMEEEVALMSVERPISLESAVSGWRMPKLYKSEVKESVESYRGSEDINSGLEDSP